MIHGRPACTRLVAGVTVVSWGDGGQLGAEGGRGESHGRPAPPRGGSPPLPAPPRISRASSSPSCVRSPCGGGGLGQHGGWGADGRRGGQGGTAFGAFQTATSWMCWLRRLERRSVGVAEQQQKKKDTGTWVSAVFHEGVVARGGVFWNGQTHSILQHEVKFLQLEVNKFAHRSAMLWARAGGSAGSTRYSGYICLRYVRRRRQSVTEPVLLQPSARRTSPSVSAGGGGPAAVS